MPPRGLNGRDTFAVAFEQLSSIEAEGPGRKFRFISKLLSDETGGDFRALMLSPGTESDALDLRFDKWGFRDLPGKEHLAVTHEAIIATDGSLSQPVGHPHQTEHMEALPESVALDDQGNIQSWSVAVEQHSHKGLGEGEGHNMQMQMQYIQKAEELFMR